MILETLVVTAVAALVTLPLVLLICRDAPRQLAVTVIALWVLGSAAMAVASTRYPRPDVAARTANLRPLELPTSGYVSSDACQACHPREYGTWHDSYHRTMTQPATPETMKAPWQGVEVFARGVVYRMERRGDEFWVQMDDPNWTGDPAAAPRVFRQVVQITGSHHWQFYWYATSVDPQVVNRRLSILLCAYRLADDPQWMPLDGCCIGPPDTGQESGTARWTRVCNKCHSTHGRPRFSSLHDVDTHVTELGIACEACHGPGGDHARSNRDPRRRYALHDSGNADPTIVNPADLDHERSSQVCGQCHAVTVFKDDEDRDNWRQHGPAFRPGDRLEEMMEIRTGKTGGGEDKFWADGMIRVSGREYNGTLASPCYERGEMSCLSCHVLHQPMDDPRPRAEWANDQLKLGFDGDAACTQCHEGFEDRVAVEAHTYHDFDSSGSRCYNCHMPHTTYGLLKGIRTHEVNSPSAASTVATGRPNACNLCHLDKTLLWAAEQMNEWYDHDVPVLDDDQKTISAAVRLSLNGDPGQRAIITWHMGWEPARAASGTDWLTPYIVILLSDPYHAVRYLALRASLLHPEFEGMPYEFMADHEKRQPNTLVVYDKWSRSSVRTVQTAGPAVLIDERTKQLNMNEVNRLLSENANKRLTLNE